MRRPSGAGQGGVGVGGYLSAAVQLDGVVVGREEGERVGGKRRLLLPLAAAQVVDEVRQLAACAARQQVDS